MNKTTLAALAVQGFGLGLGYEALLDATQVNETTLAALAEGCNGDIRLILGQLQMIRLRARSLAYDDVKVGVRDQGSPLSTATATSA